MSYLHNHILDAGLNRLCVEPTRLLLHNVEPFDFSSAISSFLGVRMSPIITGPYLAEPTGRMVTIDPITDGSIIADGKVKYWSLVDDSAERLLAAERTVNEFDVLAGNSFTMSAFNIIMPGT